MAIGFNTNCNTQLLNKHNIKEINNHNKENNNYGSSIEMENIALRSKLNYLNRKIKSEVNHSKIIQNRGGIMTSKSQNIILPKHL